MKLRTISSGGLPAGMLFVATLLGCGAQLPEEPSAGDWPQWRYDAARGAVSPHGLPRKLHLQWVRHLPPPRPAWPASQPWLRFDLSYSPVAADEMLLVPSMVNDSVTAYDTETGEQRWRFYTGGPVRLAPIADGGRVYFGSDDGYLYCVDDADGRLVWRYRGGPSDRRVLGNERLISTWPVRGGVVLSGGTLYFSAGVWPFMGIFVHAVNAESGRVVWTNSGSGSIYTTQPHGSPAFAGFVPRGHLAANSSDLIAPGGRTQPGRYNWRTSQFHGFAFGDQGQGSHLVSVRGNLLLTSENIVHVAAGQDVEGELPAIHDDDALYGLADGRIFAQAVEPQEQRIEKTDRKGNTVEVTRRTMEELWALPVDDAPKQLFLKAASRFYAGGEGVVAAIEVDPAQQAAKVVWKGAFEGEPWSMLAADSKLFVVTVRGRIYCYGAKPGQPTVHREMPARAKTAASGRHDAWTERSTAVIETANARDGYCVMLGLGSGRLAEALVRQSKLFLIAIDANAEKVETFRQRMDEAGLYGDRVSAHVGDPVRFRLPPYLASLIVSEDRSLAGKERAQQFVRTVFDALRPYGGTACLPIDAEALRRVSSRLRLAKTRVVSLGTARSMLIREGPLPGAADWTHNYADAANTVVSKDRLAKAPLGLLWFGGPSNDEVLPRHGHGPSPQVAAGRLFIEGRHMLRALDIYTGRLLWQKRLENLGRFYDNTSHQSGANEIGSNYVSLADAVYVVYGDAILQLDPATGRSLREFQTPSTRDGSRPNWGGIAAWDDLLVATLNPVTLDALQSQFKTLLGRNATWRYFAAADPEANWTTADFDADKWRTGAAGFGYGGNDDRTQLDDMRGNYRRVYLRQRFDAEALEGVGEMRLVINHSGGFVAYLNGQEVLREGVGHGNGRGATDIAQHKPGQHLMFGIPGFRKLLRPGSNVIAIEGHNSNLHSGNFSLDPYVVIRKASAAAEASSETSPVDAFSTPVRYASASRGLVVLDRQTGRRLWQRRARYGFRHNNVAIGADKLFCIDGLSQAKRQMLERRGGSTVDYGPQLLCLDVRTGEEIWSSGENVFGTFLNYSAEHDVLLQAGSAFEDRAEDEAKAGMVAHRGRDGRVLWRHLDRKHRGPCLLHHDTIFTQGPAYSLLTGEPKIRTHPLTGEPVPWQFTRNYGCNTAVASEHLMTFRSAAAGFYDLARDGGTGNLGGFKSGCTSNLIVAGGLLNAPEYTRTCGCRYHNQTSLAMVHDPEAEMWTFNALPRSGKPIRRVGINFGAPGDRRADSGTLWLDFPSQGGPSPDVPVELTPSEGRYFRYHSSHVQADPHSQELGWVAASGAEGIAALTLTVAQVDITPRKYTVRLHFAEVGHKEPGHRVFDVALQGRKRLDRFDVVQRAGGANRAVVKEFRDVEIADRLTVSFSPSAGSPATLPVLCGIELVAEGW